MKVTVISALGVNVLFFVVLVARTDALLTPDVCASSLRRSTFRPPPPPLSRRRRSRSASSLLSTPLLNADELFESPGWASIRSDLDQVPVFTCADEQGQPLKYQVELAGKPSNEKGGEGAEKVYTVPFFYTHVDDALAELDKARENTKSSGMDLIPFPLGRAFQMWATDQAVIVPNKNAMLRAGAPPDANPMGQNVPLFACMEIAQEEDGGPVLPLFFDLEDANNAVSQAASADGGNIDDLEVVCLSLPKAVNMLATPNGDDQQATAFHFVPPTSSLKHMQDYLMS